MLLARVLTSFVFASAASTAYAEPLKLAMGGQVGGSTSGRDSFPAWFVGAVGDAEKPLGAHVAASAEVRAQFYAHPEDEHFGSHGFQLDTTAGVRAFAQDAFVALRVGGGVLHGWPYAGNEAPCTRCTDVGIVAVATVGVDAHGDRSVVRVQASAGWADLRFDDDAVHEPQWQFSVGVLASVD